jgi:hypothetical protein
VAAASAISGKPAAMRGGRGPRGSSRHGEPILGVGRRGGSPSSVLHDVG